MISFSLLGTFQRNSLNKNDANENCCMDYKNKEMMKIICLSLRKNKHRITYLTSIVGQGKKFVEDLQE